MLFTHSISLAGRIAPLFSFHKVCLFSLMKFTLWQLGDPEEHLFVLSCLLVSSTEGSLGIKDFGNPGASSFAAILCEFYTACFISSFVEWICFVIRRFLMLRSRMLDLSIPKTPLFVGDRFDDGDRLIPA
jgi:hypothetical protein